MIYDSHRNHAADWIILVKFARLLKFFLKSIFENGDCFGVRTETVVCYPRYSEVSYELLRIIL